MASTPAALSAPELDRAGKEFWDGVWSHVDFPPAIDPTSPSVWAHRDQLFDRFFRANLPGDVAGSLLELGCARSAWLPYFATELGYRIAGLDYAEDGVRQTAARLRQSGLDADIRHGDLFDPPTDWIGAFDVVTWFGVAEHFENTALAVSAAATYLKPGGILITEIPNMAGLVGLLQRHDVGLARRDHLRDAPRRQLPVDAQAAMDVVGRDAEAVGIGCWHDKLVGASLGKGLTTGPGSTAAVQAMAELVAIPPA